MRVRSKLITVTVALAVIVGVLGWLAKVGYIDLNQEVAARREYGTQIGDLAPDFTLYRLDDGSEVSLSDLKGKRVFLNFWATWCPPCRVEMPYIQAVYEEKDDDVVFLAINLGESEGRVKSFMEENGYTFPVLMDPTGQAASLYLIRAIPTSFVIDADGIVRGRHIGVLDRVLLTNLLELAKGKYTD